MAILPKMSGEVDLTKPQISIKYFVMLILAVVLVLAAITVGKWGFAKLMGMTSGVTGKVEEAVAPVLG